MKTVLITGGNQGIGFETARILLRQGCRVWLGCRRRDSAETAVERLRSEVGNNVDWVALDVTSPESVDQAAQHLGREASLDVLINNAGIMGARPVPGEPYPVSEVQRVFDTNVLGVMRVTQAFLPLLSRSSSPCIVNVTSGLGSLTRHSDPSWKYSRYKHPAYVPSKAALNAYTVVLAAGLAPQGFVVNSVDPGHTATAFNHYNTKGREPVVSAAFVARAALLEKGGPTGRFLSEDDPSGELPW